MGIVLRLVGNFRGDLNSDRKTGKILLIRHTHMPTWTRAPDLPLSARLHSVMKSGRLGR